MSGTAQRILLVSGIVPCSNYSGGLFLQQIIGAAPPLAGVLALQNPALAPAMDASLAHRVPVRVLHRPPDGHDADLRPSAVRQRELKNERDFIPQAVAQVLAFAKESAATDVWLVLEGQTQIRLAHALLDRLEIPLRVQVMDPPGWWLRAHRVDLQTQGELLEQFSTVLRRAASCAAASWAMADAYRLRHGAATTAVVPALDVALAMPPAQAPGGQTLRVGFAGQAYANAEFSALVDAMRSLAAENFRERIEIHAFTASFSAAPDDGVLKVHSWRTQADLVRALADMDLLYCPYWFSDDMREESSLSFPSKLTTYLAAGRPVLFHGPADSSPACFLRRHGAAFFCFQPGMHAVRQTLVRSVADAEVYAQVARRGREAFEAHLSMQALRRSAHAFLGGGNGEAPPATEDVALAQGAQDGKDRRPLVLAVCFPMSPHAARWVNVLRRSAFRVVVFPSVLQDHCPEFGELVPVRNALDAESLGHGEVAIIDPSLVDSVATSTHDRARGYRAPASALSLADRDLPSPDSLTQVLQWLQPDVLHSLELQHAGYLCLEVWRRRTGGHFPRWLASSWGSDTFLYRKLPRHRERLSEMAQALDGFHSECLRDYPIFEAMGFRGVRFPQIAASGGVDLAGYPDPATLPTPSQRKVLLVKGYHGWAGRGLDIMLALHLIAPKIRHFEIRLFHCGPAMRRMAEALRREDGLNIVIDGFFTDQKRAIERLAQARLVIGYGISDGISTTLLESMAVGAFCVQADTACGCEWIRPGVDGMEVPAHDVELLAQAILRGATDDALVDGAVARNRREIELRWSIAAVTPTMHRGYMALLQGVRAHQAGPDRSAWIGMLAAE